MERWDNAWHDRLWRELSELPFEDAATQAAIRRTLGQDPVAFAIIYLDHHITDRDGSISFSEVHYEWCALAETWKTDHATPMANRHALIAPRNTGKTTWWFLILPLWAAAYGHRKFAAAFANATGQAETHLQTMKSELDTNPLLRHDFPELCSPKRKLSGTTVADRQGMIHQANGFTFAAKGIDAASLGLKVGATRPDLLILDDAEPDEAKYSAELARKRLATITDAILPLNIYAAVVMVGTVTMPGSIMHQLVKAAQNVEHEDWVDEECIQAHHARPILVDDHGEERSLWEEKWPLAWLQGRRHTREYAKNYDNDPMARDGVYWNREDFIYGEVPGITRTLLAVDPAIKEKTRSGRPPDYTGLAVVGFSPSRRQVEVKLAKGVRLIGQPLVDEIDRILKLFPEIKVILVETNQGGDLWKALLDQWPGVKVVTHESTESKEIRFASALRHQQWGRVWYSKRFPIMEEQMVAFPHAPFDDVADAVVAGIRRFLSPFGPPRPGVLSTSYV